jgi:hypothetical protein
MDEMKSRKREEVTHSAVKCSHHTGTESSTAGDNRLSSGEKTMALSITVEEEALMKRWGQAAKDRRREGIE